MSSKNSSGYLSIYGPVPSRRLGRSLGIDLVPFKTCTYDCIYCQLGRTTNKTLDRKSYRPVETILAELERKLATTERPDYISLAGSGEPTLNADIGTLIEKIKKITDIPVAVLTNGSLLWMKEVQDDLQLADLVVPSLDAGTAGLFHCVNRPHEDLPFERMVDGLIAFSSGFRGEIWLEVLLLAGVTGMVAEVSKIAEIAKNIGPTKVQLNSVDRPPVESFVFPVRKTQMLTFKALFQGLTEVISEPEPQVAELSGRFPVRESDILALLSRRPCTAEVVANGVGFHGMEGLKHLAALVKAKKLTTVLVDGRLFYTVSGLPQLVKKEMTG